MKNAVVLFKSIWQIGRENRGKRWLSKAVLTLSEASLMTAASLDIMRQLAVYTMALHTFNVQAWTNNLPEAIVKREQRRF